MKSIHAFKKVVCGISGGVDSAVAAAILKNRGFQVIGVYMSNWDDQDEQGTCQQRQVTDCSDAESVCSHLNIPFKKVSFVKEYWNDVFTTMLHDYGNGWTPNPDILCNRYVKFGKFYQYAIQELGADAIATGHYAQTSFGNFLENFTPQRDVFLKKSVDYEKDQTLFLSSVEQAPLRRTMFPIGSLMKWQVRKLASTYGLNMVAKKRDSIGICFIGDRKFPDFISDYLPDTAGPFIDLESGKVVGHHHGVHQWTIGQRSKVGGCKEPYFIAHRDSKSQNIYVVSGHDHPLLYSHAIQTSSIKWISKTAKVLRNGNRQFSCLFRFQHTKWKIPCLVQIDDKDSCYIRLAINTRAVTPGQQAVFYDGTVCLGSAKILWTDSLTKCCAIAKNLSVNYADPDSKAHVIN